MPKEFDSEFIEELDEIKKGLRKRHRTGVSGPASSEMIKLRDKTDELEEALSGDDEKKRERKLREAYKSSLNYEMMKRENHEEYDWKPDSEMGRERMNAAKKLRNLISQYYPEIAGQAIEEFRRETRRHQYSAAAEAVCDFDKAGIDARSSDVINGQRELLNSRRKNCDEAELYIRDQEKSLGEQEKSFEEEKKAALEEERSERFENIRKGLNMRRSGNIASFPSSEMRRLKKAEVLWKRR